MLTLREVGWKKESCEVDHGLIFGLMLSLFCMSYLGKNTSNVLKI